MYGSIFIQICAAGSKRRIFSAPECVLAIQCRPGSSKVDDFGTNRKHVCDFPISQSLWLWSYLAPFLRYGDLLGKNCLFFLPLSYSAPSLPTFPLEFCGEVNREETSHGAILCWRLHNHRWSFLWHDTSVWRTVRRSDGQTDGQNLW